MGKGGYILEFVFLGLGVVSILFYLVWAVLLWTYIIKTHWPDNILSRWWNGRHATLKRSLSANISEEVYDKDKIHEGSTRAGS